MKVIEQIYDLTVVNNIVKVKAMEESKSLIETAPVILNRTIIGSRFVKSFTCGEIIGSGKVVYLKNDKLFIASSDNLECAGRVIGMTSQAGILDSIVEVVTSGELGGLSLLTNDLYYLGLNGSLTKDIQSSGLVYPIGTGLSEDTININIENYIIRG